jgi:hypothetical protein
MNAGVRGTRVTGCIPMISRTLRISTPYSSAARKKVRYLPPRVAAVGATDSVIERGVRGGGRGRRVRTRS